MIVKNGEILAIDHIAHDNTLSGNGTSAKPVGLSQSTKDLIDSKVKKTDFETYKSSAANQISNINTKITTDESNFNSYKSSAHNEITNFKSSAHDEIARVDSDIAAVNAAKVDKTTFTQYQTDVANSFTAVNKRIDDVDAAKQNKGDYVSASNFNSYKSSAHNEIARVDGRIDATNTNLDNNYYDITETYNKTEVDEKFANFGGFKFRDPDPTKDNEPKLAPEEVIDPKAIYLTQPAGATQYLQWIWNTEVTPNVWKCIGDTTMDLSDYAKTVDVVQSANNNVQAVKDWADDKFETERDFESVIAGYYTKDEADDLLNTKVDKTIFEAYQQTVSDALDSVDRDFQNTSAWANNTFATKTDLNDVQSDLETEISNLSTDIESDLADVSGKIINELNDVESALDNKINNIDTKLDTVSGELVGKIDEANAKIDTVSGELVGKIKTVEETLSANIDAVDEKVDDLKTELERDYYDADTIEDILAASGDYYDKDEIDSLLDDYVKTEELEPINEKIDSISTEFNKYYTKTDVDDKFTTKDTFDITIADINNDLDDIVETVSAIDQDVASLSAEIDKKFNTVIESSDSVIATPTTKPDGTISYTLSAHDGKQVDYLWKPTVNAAGDISWELALTGDTPDPANIKGPQGIQGVSGTPGKNGENGITPKLKIDENDIWNVSYDNEETWTSLGVSATGPKGETGAQGPQGISGTPGKNGENGITPHIGANNHWFIEDYDTGVSATGPQGPAGTNGTNGKDGTDGKDGVSPTVTTATIAGGNRVTFTYGEGSTEYIDVMSGVPGLPGVSPTVTVTNIPADPSDPDHKNGGTEITIIDATSTNKFSAWNGNDGTMAGAPGIEGKNGISAVLAGSTYEVGLSSEFYKAVTSVSSKLDASVAASTYATKDALNDYLTKDAAAEAYQPKGEYLSANALNGYATETWVGEQGYLQTIPSEYITETELANYNYATTGLVDEASAHAYAAATADANTTYVTKASAHNEFANYVATADLLINASNQLTGIKIDNSTNYPIPLFGGVTTDNSTITGDGNTNHLGVAWSALSGNTITSALSAGSASYAAVLGTTASYSALSDIADAINNAKFAGVSIADGSSITGNGLSTNKLGLVTSAENALTAVDNKLDKTAIVTATIDNTNYVTAVNINSTNIPIKGTSFWEVTAATGTTASNDTWQHYISTTNTFNYYKMVIHPYGTSSAQEWANDGIIHIILEA